MKNREDIQKEVDLTLGSLDGLTRAETAPFFYTRLKARMSRQEAGEWSRWMGWLARPSVSMGILLLFLLINGYLLFNLYNQGEEQLTPTTDYVAQQISYFEPNTP